MFSVRGRERICAGAAVESATPAHAGDGAMRARAAAEYRTERSFAANHGTIARIVERPPCAIGRRPVSIGRSGPADAEAAARRRKNAGDPAARQPRRRSDSATEIAGFCSCARASRDDRALRTALRVRVSPPPFAWRTFQGFDACRSCGPSFANRDDIRRILTFGSCRQIQLVGC